MFHTLEKEEAPSVLRIYSWEPQCISIGYSQKVEEEIDLEKAKALGWDVVKRPTGGGIVFHNQAEVSYSLVTDIDYPLLPKGLIPSYKKISEAIVYALDRMGIVAQTLNPKSEILNKSEIPARPAGGRNPKSQLCFSYPTEYEIVVDGEKIVGSAQKRGKRALLQQGSIFVRSTPHEAFSVLKKPFKEYNAVSVEETLGREVGFEEISEALIGGFKECLGVKFDG